jgi:RNase P/RNase MRP subunit POP5
MKKGSNKVRSIKPSLREKKRYVVFELITKDNVKINSFNVKSAIEKCLKDYVGTKGMAGIGFIFLPKFYNEEKNSGLFRVTTKGLNDVRAGLLFLKNINNIDVIFRIKFVSGILKKARERV